LLCELLCGIMLENACEIGRYCWLELFYRGWSGVWLAQGRRSFPLCRDLALEGGCLGRDTLPGL